MLRTFGFVVAALVGGSRLASAQVPVSPAPGLAAPKTKEVSVIVGASIPINGLVYNGGIGIRAGAHFGKFYVGGMLAVHQGDTKTIVWGPVPALGIQGGPQTYDSLPLFVVADGGYTLTIPLGGRATTFTPYLSAGLLAIILDSAGAYGESSTTNAYFVIGGGFSYRVPVADRYSVGIHYRMYNVGDTSFEYGNLSEGTVEHGFSTSIFYAAFYGELAYHF